MIKRWITEKKKQFQFKYCIVLTISFQKFKHNEKNFNRPGKPPTGMVLTF